MRKFDETALTKLVVKALQDAIFLLEDEISGQASGELQEYKDLYNKIQREKLDVRLTPRED